MQGGTGGGEGEMSAEPAEFMRLGINGGHAVTWVLP